VELETVEENEEVLKLKLTDANEAIANSLRRAMMVKVPTLATKTLEISANDSPLFDEILANRVGQIPFTIPQNVEEGDTVHLALKQEGPTTVTANDISANNDEAEPVNDAKITELDEDKKLEFEAEAELQTGETHAKHQGGTIGYEKTNEGEFLFRIESTSGYSNKDLLQAAIDVIREDLAEFEERVEDL